MLTVMGAVMTYVTPMVATAQPKPLTDSFSGFGMLGLLVGYIFTLPMTRATATAARRAGRATKMRT